MWVFTLSLQVWLSVGTLGMGLGWLGKATLPLSTMDGRLRRLLEIALPWEPAYPI